MTCGNWGHPPPGGFAEEGCWVITYKFRMRLSVTSDEKVTEEFARERSVSVMT